ncbi:hypothetical protein UF64_14755 [Thalassospira sp. HJ]|uniref:hypothetical protein n=1 Tax=Thalassospira sp. HJ TaxID=1616823 RepID=UPI0005CDF8CF|nr:hypothetical protein [Thalassospira sp. HJ]KJE34353.1 hypothetical protein UF64_14755 [Thalassospira sp. HJ]
MSNFTKIAKRFFNSDKDYALVLMKRGDDIVCVVKSPSDDISSKIMPIEEGIKLFLLHKGNVHFESYNFVVIDDDDLWNGIWGNLVPDPDRTTQLIGKPMV